MTPSTDAPAGAAAPAPALPSASPTSPAAEEIQHATPPLATTLEYETPAVAQDVGIDAARRHRFAVLMLLVATVLWGFSFMWAKDAGDAANAAAGLPTTAHFGPSFVAGARFTLASLLYLTFLWPARKGWSAKSLKNAAMLGSLLATGILLQVWGLASTSEAVSAFLTSLTVLFVPTILAVTRGVLPGKVMAAGVAAAVVGIWLMTGASPTGFGVGELLGLSCSVVFSVHLIAVNRVMPTENAWRMTAGQFATIGLAGLATALVGWHLEGGTLVVSHWADLKIWGNIAMLIALPTLFSFGIMMFFQPRVDPTRAAMIYLLEPVFAGGFAWIFAGRGLGATALIGAALILVANAVVELQPKKADAPAA
jgi:drug/metabolite transporter (DMT)-like permease